MVEIGTYALDAFEDEAVLDIVEENSWMKECTFTLITKRQDVTQYISDAIAKGVCAVDLETTSLNTREELPSLPTAKIVGVCLATSSTEGVYIPVGHDDTEYNVPYEFMLRELKRLVMNCICVYHNFKYDGAVLQNHGIYNTDENMYEDTLIMASIVDASNKNRGLKHLSETILKRPMVEIVGLGISGNTKKVVAFNMVHPRKAVYYGGSDAVNTFGLYEKFKKDISEQDPSGKSGPWTIYKVEKRCLYVTLEMERNLIQIDIPYLKVQRDIVNKKCEDLLQMVFEGVGRKFDINSPKQLGTILFDELKIPYPSDEKTSSGQYQTSQAILEKINTTNPIGKLILTYRSLQKMSGTYLTNLIENADENGCSKFQMNQNRADTGRFTASGGTGLYDDGYSGVNCQNIPSYNKKDPDSVDIRKALVARPGFKIVTIDYSGEELRIATNMSKEPNWLKEFTEGTGDLHTITARAIYQKKDIDKSERGVAKTINFLTVYGGGAGGFAQVARIPLDTAKTMQALFFRENKGLKKWIDDEAVRSRKRGYSRTALGRRRPLAEFYSSPDKGIQAKGDRCAVNSAIQGSGADVIKIALYRVWKWIHEDPIREKNIKILMPIHDEIVYEVRETFLEEYIPELSRIMKLDDITERLGWPVKFEVDAEYGDSFSITHDFKDFYTNGEFERIQKLKLIEEGIDPDTIPEAAESTKLETELVKEPVEKDFIDEKIPEIANAKNSSLRERIDARGFFNYTVENSATNTTAIKLSAIFKLLKSLGDSTFIGPACPVKILDKKGSVVFKTKESYNIDAFVAICLWNEI